MAWQPKQKGMFVRACKAVGINDEQRKMILSQCNQRAIHKGRITSTSPKLTQADYDHCMSVVEGVGNGQIKVRDGRDGKLLYKPGYFAQTDEAQCRRLRFIAMHIARHLFVGNEKQCRNDLDEWIDSSVRGGRCMKLEQLTLKQLQDLCNGLKASAKRNHVMIPNHNYKPARMSVSSSKQGREDAHQPITNNDIPF